jgi:hypothetical protein
MMRTVNAIGLLAAAMTASLATPAAAQVLNAVYRGTLVCDKLPFTKTKMREAIVVTIVGGGAHYTHVVRLKAAATEAAPEQGFGTVIGQNIRLQGSWSGGNREYKAAYSGTFVRRAARLKGTQTWAFGGKTITRACSGAIKRPLKAFLPRQRKPPR